MTHETRRLITLISDAVVAVILRHNLEDGDDSS